MENKSYNWKFASVGGEVRVKITSGEDIAHLGELDKKMWTVLSSPVQGLEFDQKFLDLLDTNKDGKIRTEEVIAAGKYVTDVIKNKDLVLNGDSSLPLSEFNEESEEGKKLHDSAVQILKNLKLEKDSIALEDTEDNTKIFAESKFNGDGIIPPASADEEALKELITTISETIGKSADRSGADGVTAENIEAFYTACTDFKAWKDAAEEGKKDIFPFGDDTEAALAAVDALKDKVADYFMRCKLIAFDESAAETLDMSIEKLGQISAEDLSKKEAEIASYPLARPSKEGVLPLVKGLNPAWKAAVGVFKGLVAPEKDTLSEEEWNAIVGKFAAFSAWKDAKKGAEVEGLGLEAVEKVLKENKKDALLALVEKDKELEPEALAIEAVGNFLRLFKNIKQYLDNYVNFTAFYDPDQKAVFQAGRLYIDQRSTDLCIRVEDMGKHAGIAGLSGMYILYCACSSKDLGKSMNIAAVLTKGKVDDLRVGKNAVFYDRNGNAWDATVTQIVENPISLSQAFWAPYRKAARWISDKIDKAAADKEAKGEGTLSKITEGATTAPAAGAEAATKAAPFDIGKLAGITIAFAAVSGVLVAILAVLKSLSWWQWIVLIIALMLVISLPSVFIAWRKIRKRDLGPMLNANGWAINASSLVNNKFGKTLTSVVKYPKLTAVDPEARKRARRRKAIIWILILAILACLGYCGWKNYEKTGNPFKCKVAEEPVEEVVEEAATEAEAPAIEEVAAAAEEAPAEAPAE